MSNYLKNLEKKYLSLVKRVGQEAQSLNLNAYLVGGIVRDLILNRKVVDLDIVIEGDAFKLAERLKDQLNANVKYYQEFRTATLELPDQTRVDLATARKETYPTSGALPVVEPSGIIADLSRRDFTINSIALSLAPKSLGEVIDPFSGTQDLKEKKIRILHPKSFEDDPTRILRAVRFAHRFSFVMESLTLRALKKAVQGKFIRYVNPSRYYAELRKIFLEANPASVLKDLDRLGALSEILWGDGSKSSKVFNQSIFPAAKIYRNYRLLQSKNLFYREFKQDVVFGFLVLLDSLTVEKRREIVQRFPFKREEARAITDLARATELILKLRDPALLPSEVYQFLTSVDTAVILYLRCYDQNQNLQRTIDRYLKKDRNIKLSITGEDLKNAGILPGEDMGRILNQTLYATIDGHIRTRKQQLLFAQSLV